MLTSLKQTRQGMRPTRWGPIVWYFLFCTIWYWEHHYQTKRHKSKKVLLRLVSFFRVLLYCRFCRDSFNVFYEETQPEKQLANDKTFSILQWLYQIHERVNMKLDKPSFPFELIPEVYVYENNELEAWQEDTVSRHYFYCFWCILYLTACNFPPNFDQEVPFDREIQNNAFHLFHTMVALFPNHGAMSKHLKASFTLENKFESRIECFQFVYQWECRCNNGKSVFGKNINQVAQYFETHFRTPEQN